MSNLKAAIRDLSPPIAWRMLSAAKKIVNPTGLVADPPMFEKDDFLVWLDLAQPGPGMWRGALDQLAYCINHLPSQAPIIEIGSFAGHSINVMTHLLKLFGRENQIFSADAWIFEGGSNVNSLIPGYRDHVVNSFHKNVRLFSGDRLPHHIEMMSDDFFAAWRSGSAQTDVFGRTAKLGGPISLAYIDGDHSFAQSMADFQNVDQFLEVGGFVIFDDSEDNKGWGSNETALLVKGRSDYKLQFRNPHYCFQKTR